MAHRIVVLVPEQDPVEYPLPEGRVTLGSQNSNGICVDYQNEVDPQAAVIELRGEAVFIQNLNQFPIFVGQRELASAATTEWSPYEQVFLTRSVSLRLKTDEHDAEEDTEVATGSKSTMQIAVTLVCLGLCYYLLTSEESGPKTAEKLDFGFDTLVAEIEAEAPPAGYAPAPVPEEGNASTGSRRNLSQLPYERQTVLSYLTDAGRADARWGMTGDDPQRAVNAYELLLNYRPIREARSEGDTVEAKIRVYASARLLDLASDLE